MAGLHRQLLFVFADGFLDLLILLEFEVAEAGSLRVGETLRRVRVGSFLTAREIQLVVVEAAQPLFVFASVTT